MTGGTGGGAATFPHRELKNVGLRPSSMTGVSGKDWFSKGTNGGSGNWDAPAEYVLLAFELTR